MQTEAIILKTKPLREHDLLVHCYSDRSGLLVAVARGALRDGSVQAMHLDQGNLVRFQLVAGNGLPIITGAHAVEVFAAVKNNLIRQMAVWALLESVSVLVTDQEQDERLYSVLKQQMGTLAGCEHHDILPSLRNGQRLLLRILGYAPSVATCGVCGASPDDRSTFSVELGGVVCAACVDAGWHGIALAEDDRRWLSGDSVQGPCVRVPVKAPTERLIEYIAGRSLRSLELLFSALGA